MELTNYWHLRVFLLVTAAWIVFWLIGLPDYYRQYSLLWMLVFDLALLGPLWWVLCWILQHMHRAARPAAALWLAFYISVPLLLYDALYCGVYLGRGVSFLWEYWYLSVYYVVPWIMAPAAARRLNRHVSADGRRT